MLALKKLLRSDSGNVLITLALCLLVLCAFLAFGVEAGRWYLVRAELSKSVDAGSLMGAKNISNPHVDPEDIAEEIGQANFDTGFLATPEGGQGAVEFDAQMVDGSKVTVEGTTDALGILSKLWGIDHVDVGSVGAAAMKEVEIMMVLDRSGSMAGQPMADLKVAAKSFIDHFQDSEDRDKVGLVSFSHWVSVDRPLGNNFVSPMKTAIDGMIAQNFTNPEDALDQANGPLGLTDQSGVPADRRVAQFVIFFSDGRPNSFRGQFRYKSVTYDAIARGNDNCDPGDPPGITDALFQPTNGSQIANSSLVPTGDGLNSGSACGNTISTRWYLFDWDPVPGYGPAACNIPNGRIAQHICDTAQEQAIAHAGELKDDGVTVFVIALGEEDKIGIDFLNAIATSPEHVYRAPTSDQLEALFQKVAKQIKLRLVS